jgi:hypothetical protein
MRAKGVNRTTSSLLHCIRKVVERTELVLSLACTIGRILDECLSFGVVILGSWFLIEEYSGKCVCLVLYLSYNEGRVLPAVDVVQVDTLVPPSDTTVAPDQQVPLSRSCLNSAAVMLCMWKLLTSSRGPAAYRGFSIC